MKRQAESRDAGPGPLFTIPAAREQGHSAARAAADRASRLDSDWKRAAVEAVKDHATRNREMLAEHVRIVIPEGADRRAVGHVFREAQRLGYVRADGYAPAASSNGSPKCRWRSLIYEGAS
jgi:hypothetical protein